MSSHDQIAAVHYQEGYHRVMHRSHILQRAYDTDVTYYWCF